MYNIFFLHIIGRCKTFCDLRRQTSLRSLLGKVYKSYIRRKIDKDLSLFFYRCLDSLRSHAVTGVDFFDGLPHSQTFHLEFIYLCTLRLINLRSFLFKFLLFHVIHMLSLEWTHPHYFKVLLKFKCIQLIQQ